MAQGTHVVTASAHIITAVIGTGILSLSWDVAQLGWIVGPIVLLFFAFVTYITSHLLVEWYERNRNYMDVVRDYLGEWKAKSCAASLLSGLFGAAISYTVGASLSMKAMHATGKFSSGVYKIGFGIVQLFLSQIPSFDQLWWLSMVSAPMCLIYPSIVIGLSVAKVAETREIKGTRTGILINGSLTRWQKTFKSFQVVGNIMFAFSYSLIHFVIQNTIPPPSEYKTMKEASRVSLSAITILYVLCGCVGYAAFGDLSPQNLLTGTGFYNPYWLLDIAHAAVVIHHVGAYQIWSQPFFALIEKIAEERLSRYTTFLHRDISIGSTAYKFNPLRVVSRCIFVIITTLMSLLIPMPVFKDVVGVLGAAGNWHLAVHYPVTIYIAKKGIARSSKKGICLQLLSMSCLAISVAAAVGSFVGLVSDVKAK